MTVEQFNQIIEASAQCLNLETEELMKYLSDHLGNLVELVKITKPVDDLK
jgi:hypothetical protein